MIVNFKFKILSIALVSAMCIMTTAAMADVQPDPAYTWRYFMNGGHYDSPAVGSDGKIYAGPYTGQAVSSNGRFFILNSDGSLYDEFDIEGFHNEKACPVLTPNGDIIITDQYPGRVRSMQIDGTVNWTRELDNYDIRSAPALGSDGTIYIGCRNKVFYALDPADGSIKWTKSTYGFPDGSPAIGADGTIYFGTMFDRLYAMSPEGTELWFTDLGGDIDEAPAIGSDGTLYVGTSNGTLHSINPADGSTNWEYDTNGTIEGGAVIGNDGTIFVGSGPKDFNFDGNAFHAVNPNGIRKWKYQGTGDYAFNSSPVVGANGRVFAGSTNGYLYEFNPDTGNVINSHYLGGSVQGLLKIGTDGALLTHTNDSYLYGIATSTTLSETSPWPCTRKDNENTGSSQTGSSSSAVNMVPVNTLLLE